MMHRYDDPSGIELHKETKWLRFIIVGRKPKTLVINVYNKNEQSLGEIAWCPALRQYTFMSEDGTLYNDGCLDDIKGVLTDLNKAHKDGSK